MILILSALLCSCAQAPKQTNKIKFNIDKEKILEFPELKVEPDGTIKRETLELGYIKAAESYKSCKIELQSTRDQMREFEEISNGE